jgi:nucleotide-binding universal stress UspA family protein
VPVLIIGPEADLSRGLPLAELVMPIDDSPEAVRAARLAADWAIGLRIALRFLSFVPPGASATQAPETVRQIHDEIRARVPSVVLELIETEQPAGALVAIAAEQVDAVILLPGPGGTGREPLDAFAGEVVRTSTRAVLLAPPGV